MSGTEDAKITRRNYTGPYTPHNPIPTIKKYREEKHNREEQYSTQQNDVPDTQGVDSSEQEGTGAAASRVENKNLDSEDGNVPARQDEVKKTSSAGESDENDENDEVASNTSEINKRDPREQRKHMKKRGDKGTEREVTDPVTHLPVTVHDFTSKDLKNAPENEPPHSDKKSQEQLEEEEVKLQEAHESMETLFPPPDFDSTMVSLTKAYQQVITAGLGMIAISLLGVSVASKLVDRVLPTGGFISPIFLGVAGLGVSALIILGMQQWIRNKAERIWHDSVWEGERQHGRKMAKKQTAESTQWLNSLLSSVWPLVNPDLFTSLADMLEDVMQASLPRMIRMVSVDDIGQGSESVRILGVRWLPGGAAAMTVSKDGQIAPNDGNTEQSDRTDPSQGQVQNAGDRKDEPDHDQNENQQQSKNESQEEQNVEEGMEAEEGDFVNLEIAFAYRARSSGRHMKERAKNAHIYMSFYLPAGIKIPIWAELHGVIGTMRVRLQLTPDPPFFSLCTLTFLGQPKVDLSCIPLVKRGLNIMDIPLISQFVQSSVDAAMAEYVAPKSLTLDLKDMLVGDDFKKDTTAKGVLVVHIKRAYDFKEGDSSIIPFKEGSADPYVSVGWAKFGKPMWSTRVIMSEMQPYWEETAYLLVTPSELNVDERLRLQLWDSDRATADDDLGHIEVDLKQIMRDRQSNGKMWDRDDGFKALKAGEGMPGKLQWSVGYFSKTRILDSQLAEQSEHPDVKTIQQLKAKVNEESERKLREAKHNEYAEIEQQKAQDFKERQDHLITGTPPSQEYPTGILSIQIHEITGLELESPNKPRDDKHSKDASDEEEEGDDLPSSYCTVILNHQKVFKTRTKPKNSKPFFNAGCERLVRDWRTAEVHISVRNAKVHEDDSLLGIIYLPLWKLFANRSQIDGHFPLQGGTGFGKARVSLVFRSVKLQAPGEQLGWDYGVVDISPEVKAIDLPSKLQDMGLKFRTTVGKGKMQPKESGVWKTKGDKQLRIPVRKRYCTPLIIKFKSKSTLSESTDGFAVLWLRDIPDEEEKTIKLAVWNGDVKKAASNCLPSYGEQIGSIEIKLAFRSGLSGYHHKLASKDKNLSDVLEVLETCNDQGELEFDDGHDSSSSSDSSDNDDDDDDDNDDKYNEFNEYNDKNSNTKKATSNSGSRTSTWSNDNLEEDGTRGPIDQLKDYKAHRKQLHRKNRGAMQWKGPRTLQWMKHKVEHGGHKVSDLFNHHERDPGVETEV